MIPTHIRDHLSYDPTTGHFTWLTPRGSVKAGARAGKVQTNGNGSHTYVAIKFDGREYAAHRLAWWFMTGVWSEKHIDHRDGNSLNNRLSNLREATPHENMRNQGCRRTSTIGLKGVTRAGKHFSARIQVAGRRLTLGKFTTPQAAHGAYLIAAHKHYGEFARAA